MKSIPVEALTICVTSEISRNYCDEKDIEYRQSLSYGLGGQVSRNGSG